MYTAPETNFMTTEQQLSLSPQAAHSPEDYSTGVIVARFQTPFLHSGQKALLEYVNGRHPHMIIILGIALVQLTENDPYDFSTRAHMVRELYPNATIIFQKDRKKDSTWSKDIDNQLRTLLNGKKALLYGSRDSFIPYYKPYGGFPTQGLDTNVPGKSGTSVRKEMSQKLLLTKDARIGYLKALVDRRATAWTAVDIAGINDRKQVMLGKKPDEDFWRFPGGMKEITDKTFEAVAQREFSEETGGKVPLNNLEYFCSLLVAEDPRYKKLKDKIQTVLFIGEISNEDEAVPSDDLSDGLRMFDIPVMSQVKAFSNENIMPEHRELFEIFVTKFWIRNLESKRDRIDSGDQNLSKEK